MYTDVVWPEPKQIALIDSIFRNYYVPPIVFAVHLDDEDVEVRICVDGKQVHEIISECFSRFVLKLFPAPHVYTEVFGRSSAA